jgi:hypothetical protein
MTLEQFHSGKARDVHRDGAGLVPVASYPVASDPVSGYHVILPDADPRCRRTGRTWTA